MYVIPNCQKQAEMYLSLDPDEILYTHGTMLYKYCNGMWVEDVERKIIQGEVSVTDIPLMRVYTHEGKYYSQDNRRLYMFKISGLYVGVSL